MKYTLKLLICYHKRGVLLKDDILTPVHVGRSLARKRLGEDSPEFKWLEENMTGDDTGDNISDKNSSYNELTAAYWAWKNYDKIGNPDYIGLMHYRRHFIFRPSYNVVENVNGIDENYYKRINYSEETMEHLFDDCDFVAHVGHVDQVEKHYRENHHIADLELAVAILKEKYPEYANSADRYLKMSYVNLCNMFIMPKAMFFEYCSWLFDILGEFERRVDLTDKRLFISERLTGIFIEHQKSKGLKEKALPATYVNEDVRIPVVMPYCKDEFCTEVTMSSILRRAKGTTHVDFYVLHHGEVKNESCDPLHKFVKAYPGNTLQFVNVSEWLAERGISNMLSFPEHYPLVVSEILDNVNKLLYLDERAFFFGDAGAFLQTCNNDEFAVLGLPASDTAKAGDIAGHVFAINAARLRRLRFMDAVKDEKCLGASSAQVFKEYLPDQVGTIVWWLYNITDEQKDGTGYYDKPRGAARYGVWDRCMLYYGKGMEPWRNIQALYSVYWWEAASELPAGVPFASIDSGAAELFRAQAVALMERSRQTAKRQPKTRLGRRLHNYMERFVRSCRKNGLWKTAKKAVKKVWRKLTR